jgi:hypothetical protein
MAGRKPVLYLAANIESVKGRLKLNEFLQSASKSIEKGNTSANGKNALVRADVVVHAAGRAPDWRVERVRV